MNKKIFLGENLFNHKRRKNSIKVKPGERQNNYGDISLDSNDIQISKKIMVTNILFTI